MTEENKDAVTKMDITLHDKSHDVTDAKLKLDNNIYQADEISNHEVGGDFMNDMRPHGRSQITLGDGLNLDSTFSRKMSPNYKHSGTSINRKDQLNHSISKRTSKNFNLTSIDNMSGRKEGSPKSSYAATAILKSSNKENKLSEQDEIVKRSKRITEKYDKQKDNINDESKNRKLKEFKKILKRKDDNLPFEDGEEEAEAIDQQVISENRKNMKKS